MNIDFQIAPLDQWQTDALILFRFEDDEDFGTWTQQAAPWAGSSRALADFSAAPRTTAVAYPPSNSLVTRIVAAGLGKREQLDLETLHQAAATAMRACRDLKVQSVGLALDALVPAFEDLTGSTARALEEVVTAALLGLYKFDTFKSSDEDNESADTPERLQILCAQAPDDATRAAVERARAAAAGVYLTRDLVNTPANVATPTFMAATALQIGQDHGFSVKVLEAAEIEEMGMGCFSAVFQGSQEPPKLIVIDTAPKSNEKPLVFIGKGVTFDTGGISIKPSAKMDEMKGDMAGAAAVLGALEALGKIADKKRVVAIVPCTDNMPDGAAIRPGDVVTAYSGKTVEIVNTDAEGRLLLCDAISYAAEFDPALIVDLATLTGACLIALGNDVAAVFSASDLLADSIADFGASVGDLYWRLPLWDRYFEPLKSDVADMKNVGGREGGAICAALFLKQFVPTDNASPIPWAHLDIAGPAFTSSPNATSVKGGTGFGVRTLLELATRWK